MLFELAEINYQLDLSSHRNVEMAMADHYEAAGFSAIHHDFYLFHEAKNTKYPENEALLKRVIGEDKLRRLREISKTLYPHDVGAGLRPEQPDLFVYSGSGDYYFCEVKRMKTGDILRSPQMIGISLIYSFHGVNTELAVVVDQSEKVPANGKTYQWVWPAIQECGFHRVEVTGG